MNMIMTIMGIVADMVRNVTMSVFTHKKDPTDGRKRMCHRVGNVNTRFNLVVASAEHLKMRWKMNDRYISLEDLLIWLDSEMEYAKLTGNFDKVTTLAEVKEQAEGMPYIEFPKPKPIDTVMYKYTEERE